MAAPVNHAGFDRLRNMGWAGNRGDVEFATLQLMDQVRIGDFVQLNWRTRATLFQFADDPDGEIVEAAGRHAKPDRSPGLAHQLCKAVGKGHVAYHGTCVRKKGSACCGQLHILPRTLQKLGLQHCFQPDDGLAERRLLNGQTPGRAPEIKLLAQRNEILEMGEVHEA